MLGLGKAGTARASAAAASGRSQDIYRRYAVALYTQALLPWLSSSSLTSPSMSARWPWCRSAAKTMHVIEECRGSIRVT
jgi:hypothetical protein